MKKSALIFAAIAFTAFVFSSCRTTENCPAYGKVNSPAQQEVNG